MTLCCCIFALAQCHRILQLREESVEEIVAMKRIMLSTLAAVYLMDGVTVYAADLPARAPVPVSAPAAYNWTGIYIGVNGGYGWGRQDPLSLITTRFDSQTFGVNGGTFGGTSGAQLQVGRVVLGVESDIAWANIKGNQIIAPAILGLPIGATVNMSSDTKWIGTARMRVGYGADNILLYGTLGVAALNAHANGISVSGITCGTAGVLRCTGSHLRPGIAAGAGLEYGFTHNWSAKFEYLWIGASGGGLAKEHINQVRGGINYRFGGV